MPKPIITLDRIAVRQRDRWLLDGLSWRINEGDLWSVVGSNGAGKTTLAKAIAGILPVVKGKIHYHGFGRKSPLDSISYVGSDDRRGLWRLERELDHGRSFAGRFSDVTMVHDWFLPESDNSLPDNNEKLFEIIETFSLGPLLEKPVMALSTGEMSRVLLAKTLTHRPKLLILDEPFDGLDHSGRNAMREALNQMAEMKLSMIFITHRPEEMLNATTHVLTIEGGKAVRTRPFNRLQPSGDPNRASAFTFLKSPTTPTNGDRKKKSLETEALLEMKGVTVRYGDTTVLNNIDWIVREGEHWAVTGPNGAGKSTLLKLITGECLQVYANRVRLFGKDRGNEQTLWEIREKIGTVSHDLAAGYQKKMTALDVICSGYFNSIGLYRFCDGRQVDNAKEWMNRLNIRKLEKSFYNQLSRGQRQMVLIARAMVKLPMLLILDEPCAGLDSENRTNVLATVNSIFSQLPTNLIFVTHQEEEIPPCITNRLMLQHGEVVESTLGLHESVS